MPDGPPQDDRPAFVPPTAAEQGPVFVKAAKERRPPDVDAPWPGWLGPIAILVAYVVVFAASIVLVVIAGPDNTDEFFDENTHWLGLLQDVLWIAVALWLPLAVAKHLLPEQLGLRRAPIARSLGIGVVLVIAFYAVSAGYTELFDITSDDNELLRDLGFGSSVRDDVIYALVFTVGAPVAEELLFRGLLFRALRDSFIRRVGRRGGIAAGVVISGAIFGLVHAGGGQDAFLPVLMILGMLLAIAYQWSGTIYVPIAMHAWNNALATALNPDATSEGDPLLNPQVSAEWINWLTLAGPVIALAVAFSLAALIKVAFRSAPPSRAPAHPADV